MTEVDFTKEIAFLEEELDSTAVAIKEVDESIINLLRQNQDIPRQISSTVTRLQTQLALVESDASQLSSMFALTCVLAENVSGKVRELDLAKGRVVDCLQRVEDILDLRLCTEGVQTALQNEDFEQAAGHIHRFLALDESLLAMAALEGESESLKQSCDVLRRAREHLASVVREKFDEAVKHGDVASMERFFKIFPLLNQHDVGLQKFGAYLKEKIQTAAESNYKAMIAGGQDDQRRNVLYADTLTLLFEGIARVIEVHQPLVETYYGPERMLNLMDILQEECDVQAKRIIDQFVKVRQYDRKARLIDNYARNAGKFANLEKLDPIELDVLLSEVTLMHTRAELYLRFVKRRIKNDISTMAPENPNRKEKMDLLDRLVSSCQLSRAMQELLNQYVAMEEYFMRESVHKAISLDEMVEGSLVSSMVDMVFFLVKKSIRRSMSSSSVDCVCAMINDAATIVDADYYSVLHTRLKAGYPTVGSLAEAYTTAAAAYTSVIQQGKMPASSADTAEKARIVYITTLNNVDMSRECLERLKDVLKADVSMHISSATDQEQGKLDNCLSSFAEVGSRFGSAAKFGLEQLVSVVVKPRVKTWVDTFNDYSHAPTDAEFAAYEANDPFVEGFMTNLDGLLASFKNSLTERNYEGFVSCVATEVASNLERAILKSTFNQLGGLQLDKELRELTNYISSVTNWAVREKFGRLSQISSLLNVDKVGDVVEWYNSDHLIWRMTPTEVRQILALRIDLPGEEVRKLKL